MIRVLLAAAAAVSLSACASSYVAKPYERSASGIKSIALADDSVPQKAAAYEVASVGSNFGLIGALVDAGIQASRQDAVNDALSGIGFDAEAKLEQHLAAKLADEGYAVSTLGGVEREKREFLKVYPAANPSADAYLDLVVEGYGYLSAGAGQPFRPTVVANMRVVSAKAPDKALMENRIILNAMAPQKGVITLSPNPAYAFKNRADLLADPNRLAAGIEDALDQVADTAAQLLH